MIELYILFALFIFFNCLAYLSREALLFGIAGILSIVLGVYCMIDSLVAVEGWMMFIVGICLFFYGMFLPLLGLRVTLRGGSK